MRIRLNQQIRSYNNYANFRVYVDTLGVSAGRLFQTVEPCCSYLDGEFTSVDVREHRFVIGNCPPRQQKFRAMNGAHLASPIRGKLGYAYWPQLGTQFIALLGTKFGAH